SGTKITDEGLDHLAKLPQLKELWLRNTAVTDARYRRLQEALPECEIQADVPAVRAQHKISYLPWWPWHHSGNHFGEGRGIMRKSGSGARPKVQFGSFPDVLTRQFPSTLETAEAGRFALFAGSDAANRSGVTRSID